MASSKPPTHYPFVDGIRGITALYVVLNHIWTRFVVIAEAGSLPPWFHLLKFGHAAVAIFIVLSGFCLMLPIAQRTPLVLRPDFLKRRARRILPAYFAAMGLSLLLGLAFPQTLPPHSWEWQSLLTHLFLVHNWVPRWSISINGPFWSIALEWQIYFIFALVLIPLRQRFGWLTTLLAAGGISVLPLFFNLGGTNPWFLLLFVQGMLTAEWVSHPPRVAPGRLAAVAVGLALLSGTLEIMVWRDSFPWPSTPWIANALLVGLDLLLGCATGALLLVGALTPQSLPLRGIFSLLSSRTLVLLGSFSYSIYLLHDPLLALGIHYARVLIVTAPLQAFPFVLATLLPMVLGLSWLFHLAFERPFLQKKPTGRG
ncbi:acyltransferase [Armatimonas sp.]|uniref:acyltransferase family protein n=1 Tax=Armatimonas sp. TaxID=1872638 RepID=UPI00286B8859|nr:acyltransferase [Armatimonas sp.]